MPNSSPSSYAVQKVPEVPWAFAEIEKGEGLEKGQQTNKKRLWYESLEHWMWSCDDKRSEMEHWINWKHWSKC